MQIQIRIRKSSFRVGDERGGEFKALHRWRSHVYFNGGHPFSDAFAAHRPAAAGVDRSFSFRLGSGLPNCLSSVPFPEYRSPTASRRRPVSPTNRRAHAGPIYRRLSIPPSDARLTIVNTSMTGCRAWPPNSVREPSV